MTVRGQRWLDHFLITVHDLDESGTAWERLGFRVLPPMEHLDFGSRNRVIQFRQNYVELLSDIEGIPLDYREHYLGRLRIGEGHANICFSSSDLIADRAAMEQSGVEASPVGSGRRSIVMPNGCSEETASKFLYVWRPGRSYMTPFWATHDKPETIFVPEYQVHPNTAQEVVGVTCYSNDIAADARFFADASAGEVVDIAGGKRVCVACGHWVDILSPEAVIDKFDSSTPEMPVTCAGFAVGMTILVESLDKCRAAIAAAVPVREHDGGLLVPASNASGSFIHFVGE